jgi:hypothetical protein
VGGPSVQLADRIAEVANSIGIRTSLIGAYALASHRYLRATDDLDLATSVQLDQLYELKRALEREELNVRIDLPDEEDDLGGVIRVWTEVDDDGDPLHPVEVVNFFNPMRPRRNPASEAVHHALPVEGSKALRYPRLADLIALKLDAGSPRDRVDVVEVLVRNPDANLDEIRSTCKDYGLNGIDELIAQAEAQR